MNDGNRSVSFLSHFGASVDQTGARNAKSEIALGVSDRST
jgi:hypothetical protein